MNRTRLMLAVFAAIAIGLLTNAAAYAYTNSPKVVIDKDAIKKGLFKVGYQSENKRELKVIVEKGDKRYIYNLRNDGVQECYALQMGNGQYKASIYESIGGNSYIPVYTDTLELQLQDETLIYLNPIQNIYYQADMETIKKTAELVKNSKSSKEELDVIYKFVVPYLSYDYDKLKNINKLPNPYIPSIEQTYKDKKGICYDYSSFFASMLRSIGVPAKLMMGYTPLVKEYHAWNEVYMESTKKWVVIDTTYDSCIYKVKKKFDMIKDAAKYSPIKNY